MDHSFSVWNFQHLPVYIFQAKGVSSLNYESENDRPATYFWVQRYVDKLEVDCGGVKIRNLATTGGAAGRKVGGTSEIESYGIVARSVQKLFKIISICSDQLANVTGRFEKNFKVQKERSMLTAS